MKRYEITLARLPVYLRRHSPGSGLMSQLANWVWAKALDHGTYVGQLRRLSLGARSRNRKWTSPAFLRVEGVEAHMFWWTIDRECL